MSEPFLAEIRMVGFNFAPRGYLDCNGALLPINQNQALFSLIGTFYGGDGRTTFAIPDLRGRVPIHSGGNSSGPGLTPRALGSRGGEDTHTLSDAELPAHGHSLQGSGDVSTTDSPVDKVFANRPRRTASYYAAPDNLVSMRAGTVGMSGGSPNAHENTQPSLAIRFVIAVQGLFPSRN